MLSLNKHYNLGTLTDEQVDENWDDISGEVNSLLSRLPQNNYNATSDPTVNDDVTEGYSTGSKWYNKSTPAIFICTNASSGAANWVQDPIVTDDLGSAAFSDIVGTVSQSGGVPTGALMEYGSNANGEYLKLADGTMTCNRAVDLGGSLSLPLGPTDYDMPQTFSTLDDLSKQLSIRVITSSASVAAGLNANFGSTSAKSTSVWQGVSIRDLGGSYSTQGVVLFLQAKGRWF